MLNEEKFIMKRVTLLVSLNCNLKCKLCVVGSPYYTTGKFTAVSKLMDDINTLFNIVDYVEIFTISGGEPLLYKQLPQLLEELLNYSGHFGKIEIVTNGTIVPNGEFLDIIKKYGDRFLHFIVDDYGRDLSKKVTQIISVFEEHKIPYRINDYCSENLCFGGWVDHGTATEIVHTEKEAYELFAKCAQPQKMNFCFLIVDGFMSPCSVVLRRIKLGQNVDKREYIDLTDNMISVGEQRQKIKNIYNVKCLESCAYCEYALSDDAPRFKPAVQLTAEETRKNSSKLLGGNKVENVKSDIKTVLENPVIIYGAGYFGKGMCTRLLSMHVNIIGIAVTNFSNVGTIEQYKGIRIKAVEEWREYASKAVVLIATSAVYHKEIRENCINNGFNKIMVADSELIYESFRYYFLNMGYSVSGKSLKLGKGNYINPFVDKVPNIQSFFSCIDDFILPAVINDYSMVHEGTYEWETVRLSKGNIVFDLGANIGLFSAFAASMGCTSYAFEPTPELHRYIEKHNELNNGKIHIVPYAVSNQCGEATFHIDPFNSTANSLLERVSGNSVITVEQITIDEFVERERLGRVDFIKADIEGAERLMLEGASKTLKKFAPKLSLCTYHLPDDKEVLANLILKANPDYNIEYKWKKLYAYVKDTEEGKCQL